MSESTLNGPPPPRSRDSWTRFRNRLVARPAFQSWAARFPLTRRIARREGEALFDLVSGFAKSQSLYALVALDVLEHLADGPVSEVQAALRAGVPQKRMMVLLQSGAAMGVLTRHRDGRYSTAQKGAALLGVPGLKDMILHHDVFYRDLADPVAFFRGETETELAGFWPYVFGEGAKRDPEAAARYSRLMAESQGLVAEETLGAVSFKGCRHLMDVGGGTGAFLSAALQATPGLEGTLFDLPDVAEAGRARLSGAGVLDRARITPGSFRDAPLPSGADAISLVRVLYDHADETVGALLRSVRAALPAGGRLVVSEPMSGGARPDPATDVYFAMYTMAMGTGKTRSVAEVSALLEAAGFVDIRQKPTRRAFVTSVVTAKVSDT